MTEYWHSPTPILDDVLDELREAREMVAYLTRANEALAAERKKAAMATLSACGEAERAWEAQKEAEARNETLTAQLESTLKDRAQIIADRDRLRGVLQKIADRPDYRLPAPRDIARAALGVSA